MRGGQAHRPLGTSPTGMPPLSSAAGSPQPHRLPGVLSLLRLACDAGSSALGSARGPHIFSTLGCVFLRLPPPSFDSPNFCITPHYFAVTTFPFSTSTFPTSHFTTPEPTIPQFVHITVHHTSNCPSHTPVDTPSSAVALPGGTHGSAGTGASLGCAATWASAPPSMLTPLSVFHSNFPTHLNSTPVFAALQLSIFQLSHFPTQHSPGYTPSSTSSPAGIPVPMDCFHSPVLGCVLAHTTVSSLFCQNPYTPPWVGLGQPDDLVGKRERRAREGH